jgi:hypothetical protein
MSRAKLRNLIEVEQRTGSIDAAFTIDRLVMPGVTELTD